MCVHILLKRKEEGIGRPLYEHIDEIKLMWRLCFKRSARGAFDAHCVMGANRTMKRLKQVVHATMATIPSLPLMRISLFESTFEATLETSHR